MKKSFLLTLASSALLLCACGSSPSVSNPSSDSTTSESSTSSIPAIDFSLVSSCKAGSIEKDSFTITTPNPSEEYFSWDDAVIEIAINQANWAYVTAIKKDDNSILSQNEDVVPLTAISIEPQDSLSGTGGSNVINRIDLHIDRRQIKTGTTRIKTSITPSNGASSASKIELCFEVHVVPFGSIQVETTEAPKEIQSLKAGATFVEVADFKPTSFTGDASKVTIESVYEMQEGGKRTGYAYSVNCGKPVKTDVTFTVAFEGEVSESTVAQLKPIAINVTSGGDAGYDTNTVSYAQGIVDGSKQFNDVSDIVSGGTKSQKFLRDGLTAARTDYLARYNETAPYFL